MHEQCSIHKGARQDFALPAGSAELGAHGKYAPGAPA